MSGEREEVALSRWERERLASIEAELAASNPELNRRLTHGRRADAGVVLPLVLVSVGGILVTATFTRWLWVASAGLTVMAAGAFLGVRALLGRVTAVPPVRTQRHHPRLRGDGDLRSAG